MAAEEFAALKQQREAQRQGSSNSRHIALMVVCDSSAVPDIREDLKLRRRPVDGTAHGAACGTWHLTISLTFRFVWFPHFDCFTRTAGLITVRARHARMAAVAAEHALLPA